MKTAVLIHGQHLFSNEWQLSMWADPMQGVYGRAAAGLREAVRFDAHVVFFGTGASEKDGLKEGEHILKLARDRIQEIPEFRAMTAESARAWLDERAVLELTSQNTAEELASCAEKALERDIERIIIVSSPSHIPRAHKTAISVFSKDSRFNKYLHNLYAVASDTCYAGSTIDDVLIIEPPHRGDDHQVNFNRTLKEVLSFNYRDSALAAELDEALKNLIAEFKKRL